MPLYEYVCENCGEETEVLQKVSDEALTKCPKCEKDSFKKKTSRSAFHLKGGGWYKDGYNVPDSTSTSSSTTESVSSSATTDKASTSEKSETKPAEKAEKTSTPAKESKKNVPDSKAS